MATASKGRVLIVEDEPSQMEILSYNLASEGYDVAKAASGEEGLMMLAEQQIDLVLLDWMLPETSGLEVCRQIKRNKATKAIPVIMLTARGEEDDKIRGLDTGADDYVVKPYSVKELLARVRAGLRKLGGDQGTDTLRFADLEIDLSRHIATLFGKPLALGPLEFKLLCVFAASPARVYSRDQLLERVWADNLEVETRTVDVHIGRLRKHLSAAGAGDYIRTVRGVGYAMDRI